MDLILWSDELSVGIERIDEEHRELVRILNALFSAMCKAEGQSLLDETFEALMSYTRTHFSSEEALMESHGYPELAEHEAEHLELIDQLQDLRDRYEAGSYVSVETMHFLKHWLVDHIQGTDQRYADFFRARGVR